MSVDLNNLKEQIQTIFETANTTTASRDLSSGLSDRVSQILKLNPDRIPIQPSFFPCVTCYIDSKSIELKDIAKTQLAAKRVGKVSVKIAGVVWNSTVNDDLVDQADNDCEDLMENIEEILRAEPTLNGVATWSKPTDVTYHSLQIDEEAHLRAGMMNLEVTIYY